MRTRSMAEVLAEQGDFNAALEIYDELIQSTESADEKQDLLSRISTLRSMSGGGSDHGARIAAKDVGSTSKTEIVETKDSKISSPGKERVISVLAKLADKLDSRVHS